MNAAIWFGGAVFFTFVAGPVFFSEETKKIIAPYWAGAVAQLLLKKYFILHYCCAVVAFLHLFAEWLYSGRPFHRISVMVITSLLLLGLAGGVWLQPKLKELHRNKYWGTSPAIKEQAAKSFGPWHGVAQTINLIMLGGLLFYLWRLTAPPPSTRFLGTPKFRG